MTPVLGRPCLVAVDGVDGSGKTTFAESLAPTKPEAGQPVHVVHLHDRFVRAGAGKS